MEPTPRPAAPETGLETDDPQPLNGDRGPCEIAELGLPAFDWPPPRPSTVVVIPKRLYFADVEPENRTLGEASFALERALEAGGYREYSFHGVGCDGFAVITRLEKIDRFGQSVPGAERFSPPGEGERFSFGDYIARLFYAPPGYYRQIIFAATDEPFEETDDEITQAELDALVDRGDDELPSQAQSMAFTDGHKLYALIYEFEKGAADEDVALLTPNRLSGVTHLDQAGLYRNLNRFAQDPE